MTTAHSRPPRALQRPGSAPPPDEIEDLYTWGNTGRCVDIIAPGVDIFAACASDARCGHATDGTYTWASGTSMAVRRGV